MDTETNQAHNIEGIIHDRQHRCRSTTSVERAMFWAIVLHTSATPDASLGERGRPMRSSLRVLISAVIAVILLLAISLPHRCSRAVSPRSRSIRAWAKSAPQQARLKSSSRRPASFHLSLPSLPEQRWLGTMRRGRPSDSKVASRPHLSSACVAQHRWNVTLYSRSASQWRP